ncbi:MAG: FAD-dependent oxidoreductase [Candidatus Saccharibacteria bacterium]|nr:FAD-dependent oxidoreductase [Candidatus Saccharibacteria bacterium]
MKKIVIVGGGFGGVVAARKLSGKPGISVTLISDLETYRYSAALYRVATGYRRRVALIPLADILPNNVTLMHAKVTRIDRKLRKLHLKNGQEVPYDTAILSMGATTSYFGIPGLPELSYGIKDIHSLDKLRTHLHKELVAEHELDRNYVVVGGGPTGLELAAGLASYLRVLAKNHHIKKKSVHLELIEAAPRILPNMSPRASRLVKRRLKKLGVKVMTGKTVESESEASLQVSGKSIPSHTVIWTAGMANNGFYQDNANQFEFSKRHKIIVDSFLRVDPHVFVIGDNAETKYSGMAQTAVYQAEYAAKTILKEANGRTPNIYRHRQPAYVVPAGGSWAVLQYGPLVLSGFLAYLLRKAADIIGYAYVMGIRKSIQTWRQFDDLEEQCPVCRTT